LPLEEFISARDAKAKELRAEGRKEAAAEVKQARKPSLAAWALNQVARRHPDEVAGVLEAGQALAEAQRAALEGDAGGLREAGRTLGDVVERVAGRAAGLLDKASPVQRDRMAATLRAAAADEAGAEMLRRGVLVEDLEPAGFGLEALSGAVPPRRRPAAPKKTAATEAVDESRRNLRRAEAAADAAETRAQRRAERAEIAARRAAEVHREAESLRAEAEEAAGEAAAARREAEAAAGALAEAEQSADAT
jgi:hypothetical protein